MSYVLLSLFLKISKLRIWWSRLNHLNVLSKLKDKLQLLMDNGVKILELIPLFGKFRKEITKIIKESISKSHLINGRINGIGGVPLSRETHKLIPRKSNLKTQNSQILMEKLNQPLKKWWKIWEENKQDYQALKKKKNKKC